MNEREREREREREKTIIDRRNVLNYYIQIKLFQGKWKLLLLLFLLIKFVLTNKISITNQTQSIDGILK